MHGIIFGGLLEDMGMDPDAFSIRRSSGAHKLATYLRQHNYDTFFNKEKLSAEVNKTLISFLEFFDSSQVSS